jgi:hypothetical protein
MSELDVARHLRMVHGKDVPVDCVACTGSPAQINGPWMIPHLVSVHGAEWNRLIGLMKCCYQ